MAPVVSPERVTVKVNGVLPVLPSALLAAVAAIAKEAPPPPPTLNTANASSLAFSTLPGEFSLVQPESTASRR